MHKHLNQEIQILKEDLEKREQDIIKFKELFNSNNNIGIRFQFNNNGIIKSNDNLIESNNNII